MVGYQLNLATNSKMIHKSKGSVLLISNLLKLFVGTISFWRESGTLSMLPFAISPFIWDPLYFECTVDSDWLFMFNQTPVSLLIFWLGDLSSWLRTFYILTGAPCPLIIQKAIHVSSFQCGFTSPGWNPNDLKHTINNI